MAAARLAVAYFALGSLWIAGTDWLIGRTNASTFHLSQTSKGLIFVAFGSLLIYALNSRWLRERQVTTEDRARLERRLAAVARFEAIGQLTGSIAHDFNNLITAITGNIGAYVSQLGEESPPPELREAQRSADRAADLTRQLLAYGRRQVMRPERVNVNRVVEDMSGLLERLIGARIGVQMELSGDVGAVHVDPGHLEQVVMNLAINARDAMPEGGQLRIRTRSQRITEADARRFPFPILPGDYVGLDVMDDGVGIPPEIQAHIFEPFFTTKPKGVGTGLGLATVYGIVKQSSGYVTVESTPGEGTVFSVLLPRSPDPVVMAEAPAPAAINGTGTETVLVAEDDAAVRSMVMRVLQRRGFAVLEAHDGEEALEVLRGRSARVDLLITDASMPAMSGSQLIDEARSVAPDLRVLLMSGYTEAELNGGVPYMAKPFEPGQLVRRVREVLDT